MHYLSPTHSPPLTLVRLLSQSLVQRAPSGATVDSDTLFEIGSLSKTFVALGLGHLVSAGTLRWDDPVRKWLGEGLTLGPHTYVSEVLTVRDLLAHRTGLAEGQGDFLSGLIPPSEVTARLAKVTPVRSLRDVFQYSNTGWMLAGEVLRAAVGNASNWCAALHTTVLRPLNLSSTFCHRNEVPQDIAARHLAAVHKMNPCGAEEGAGGATAREAATENGHGEGGEGSHHTSPRAPPTPNLPPPLSTYDEESL